MNTVYLIIIFFFAIYGIFSVFYEILHKILKPKNNGNIPFKTIIIHDFEKAEEYLRYAELTENTEYTFIIYDFQNKNDEKMLKLLESEFDFVKIMNKDEYFDEINRKLGSD